MKKQLALHLTPVLDESDRDWQLDESTRELGRRKIAELRAKLKAVPRPSDSPAVNAPTATDGSGRKAA